LRLPRSLLSLRAVAHQGGVDKSTKARKAIFSIREKSADVYLVLKVDKVLSGDQDAATEPYFKHATVITPSLAPSTLH